MKWATGPQAVCSPGLSARAEIRAGTMTREPSRSLAAQRKCETYGKESLITEVENDTDFAVLVCSGELTSYNLTGVATTLEGPRVCGTPSLPASLLHRG